MPNCQGPDGADQSLDPTRRSPEFQDGGRGYGNAMKAMQRKWGVTEIGSGGPTLMAYPPEWYFHEINGSHDWMDNQAENMVHAQFPDAKSYTIVELPDTRGAIGAGPQGTPSYGIRFADKDGVWRILMPPPGAQPGWPFNYAEAAGKAASDFNAMRGSLIPTGAAPARNLSQSLVDGIQRSLAGKPILRGNQFDPDLQRRLMGGQ